MVPRVSLLVVGDLYSNEPAVRDHRTAAGRRLPRSGRPTLPVRADQDFGIGLGAYLKAA
jgi:hypothetical protein